jgi:hypothetical protein
MNPIEYDKRRQELVAGVHEPSSLEADLDSIESGVTVTLSLETYRDLQEVFEPMAKGEALTLGDYSWRPLLPPADLLSVELPPMLRLDLIFKVPLEYRLPILFKIRTAYELGCIASIAQSGLINLDLTDAPPEFEDVSLPLLVPFNIS